MENNFERELLERLTRIEAKIESWDRNKEQIFENQRNIIRLQDANASQQEQIDEMRAIAKQTSTQIKGAIIGAVASAGLTILMKFIA